MLLHVDEENLLNRAIIQYTFVGEEHTVLTSPHEKSQPFVRTMPSTLERVSKIATDLTPKPTIHAVSSHTGGILGAS